MYILYRNTQVNNRRRGGRATKQKETSIHVYNVQYETRGETRGREKYKYQRNSKEKSKRIVFLGEDTKKRTN